MSFHHFICALLSVLVPHHNIFNTSLQGQVNEPFFSAQIRFIDKEESPCE